MNVELVSKLIEAVVTVAVVLITAYVIPWLKSKIGENKYNEIVSYVEFAVRCAEKLYNTEQGKEKKQYVYSYILRKAKELDIELTEEDINILIEGVVHAVKG